jgi:ribosome-binding protein aMBF1 (putative translation factor)
MQSKNGTSGGRQTSDAIEILDRVFIGDDAARREAVDKAVEDALIGQMIYDIRAEAGLTQKQLAELVGTDQAVISRLEDADYEGHTMSMLRRIAKALGKRVEVRFVDAA